MQFSGDFKSGEMIFFKVRSDALAGNMLGDPSERKTSHMMQTQKDFPFWYHWPDTQAAVCHSLTGRTLEKMYQSGLIG